jgi:serine/threonine-protein kinase RsbW
LRSLLSDMAQLPGWVDDLAARYSIPKNIQFAIDVCLEEAVSNVIRYGCVGAQDGAVVVRFTKPREDDFEFVVEDERIPRPPA